MTTHRHPGSADTRPRALKRFLPLIGTLAVIAIVAIALVRSQSPFQSVEVAFTDTSAHGMLIMPGSCPSNPFDADAPYGCTGSTPLCPDGVSPMTSGTLSSCSCAQGNTAACVFTPPNGFPPGPGNTPPGPGSCPVGFSLQGGQCVFTGCPTGYIQQGSACAFVGCSAGFICQNGNQYYEDANCNISANPTQQCTYGCSGGQCSAPPPPEIATWKVSPSFVKSGETATIVWQSTNVASCTVTGSNGDGPWTGTSGSHVSSPLTGQTIYTITCQGLPGATPASATAKATVNIAPNFTEH